jgi:hypothetical protein
MNTYVFLSLIILTIIISFLYFCKISEEFKTSVNKTVWMFWEQGWDDAPEICKKCLDSWRKYNPDWKIHLLDGNNLLDFIDIDKYVKNYNSKRPIQMRADILLTNLLNQNGGLWVDATVFCTRPLSEWIYPYLQQGFFAFEKNENPPHLISNWMLYAEKDNYIIRTWAHEYNNYWKDRKTSEYFKHAYMFDDLYKNDKTFNKMWNSVKKFSASVPHILKYEEKPSKTPNHIIKHIQNKLSPLYKLDHNPMTSDVIKKTTSGNVYSYLLQLHKI